MSKRNHIPLIEKLAASLCCFLPQEQRDDLRNRKVTAKQIVSLFEFHHVVFHAHEGSDRWHNLHPMQKAAHRERSRGDTSTVAKVKRIDKQWSKFTAAMAKGRKPKKAKSKWPKQKFPTRRKMS